MSSASVKGRPKIGSEKQGASPTLAARIDDESFAAFQKVQAATGTSSSNLLREAIELLLTEYGSISGRPRKLHYADFRPILMVESLDELTGPSGGIVTLPTSIDWSPRKSYSVDDKFDRADLYRTVISEASPEQMAQFLNRDLLIKSWPSIALGQRVTSAWEQQFPELTSSGG